MIKILPLRDNEILAKLNQKEGTTARLAYFLEIEGEPTDYILYNLNEHEGIIQAVVSSEDAIADILIRAVFASLYDFSIDVARFNERVDNDMLVRLNMVKKGEWETPCLHDVLYHCENCKNK